MINLLKVKIFTSLIGSLSADRLAEILEDFGKRQFGNQTGHYLFDIQRKLAELVVAINKRRA